MNSVTTLPRRLRTLDLTYCALFTVLMAVCAWVSVPVPKPLVPFTMQTFAIFSALLCLGGRRGMYALSAYILLGAAGVPVFTGFRGGLDVLLGNTGGYILGFLFMGLTYWLLTHCLGGAVWVKILGCTLGLAVCYAFGTIWFLQVYAASTGPIGLVAALNWCVFPFLLPDAVKLGLAAALARRVEPLMK